MTVSPAGNINPWKDGAYTTSLTKGNPESSAKPVTIFDKGMFKENNTIPPSYSD